VLLQEYWKVRFGGFSCIQNAEMGSGGKYVLGGGATEASISAYLETLLEDPSSKVFGNVSGEVKIAIAAFARSDL